MGLKWHIHIKDLLFRLTCWILIRHFAFHYRRLVLTLIYSQISRLIFLPMARHICINNFLSCSISQQCGMGFSVRLHDIHYHSCTAHRELHQYSSASRPSLSLLQLIVSASLLFMKLFLYRITNTIFASPHTFSIHSYCLQSVQQTIALFRTFTNNSLCLTLLSSHGCTHSISLMSQILKWTFLLMVLCLTSYHKVSPCISSSPLLVLLSWFMAFTSSLSKINALFTHRNGLVSLLLEGLWLRMEK